MPNQLPAGLQPNPMDAYIEQQEQAPTVHFGKDALDQMGDEDKLNQILELLIEIKDRLGEIE